MPRLRNPTAALAIAALAAVTILQFNSWLATTTSTPEFADRRRLLSRKKNTGQDIDMKIVSRQLKALGLKPRTANYKRMMRRKIQRRQEIMNLGSTRAREKRLDERQRRLKRQQENIEQRKTEEVVVQNLKDKKDEDFWVRGEYLKRNGGYWSNVRGREDEIEEAEALVRVADQLKEDEDFEPLTVCNRPADVGSMEDFASLQKYSQCREVTKDEPILLLEGKRAHGRTGNNIIQFLHAIQEARDDNTQLGIMSDSWAMEMLLKMWLAIESPDWQYQFEKAFCVKVFHDESELEGWDVIHKDTKELFYYQSDQHLAEYMQSQEYQIRTLFRNYNTGRGIDQKGAPVQDMCSGIDAVFGQDRGNAIYSVIHSRSLEGVPGLRLLKNKSHKSGCDPVAALEMRPDYIKSILEPLGMLDFPIVFMSDGQDPAVLERLQSDPEIGPLLRIVPEEACWIGGDLTMAVMSNVFIGNPASSFTGFIAKSRLALGFGHNYLFRAKDENDQWRTVCGDHCIFDKSIMGVQA